MMARKTCRGSRVTKTRTVVDTINALFFDGYRDYVRLKKRPRRSHTRSHHVTRFESNAMK